MNSKYTEGIIGSLLRNPFWIPPSEQIAHWNSYWSSATQKLVCPPKPFNLDFRLRFKTFLILKRKKLHKMPNNATFSPCHLWPDCAIQIAFAGHRGKLLLLLWLWKICFSKQEKLLLRFSREHQAYFASMNLKIQNTGSSEMKSVSKYCCYRLAQVASGLWGFFNLWGSLRIFFRQLNFFD